MSKRVTLHTVASEAGVSIATVSKVVNGLTSGISENTRTCVEEAVKRLGYRPNRIGRGLRTLQHSTIGMVVMDPSPTFLADPFTTNLVAGLSNALSTKGFGLLVHGVNPSELERSYLVKELEADALCVTLSGPSRLRRSHLRLIAELGHPVIVFQESLEFAPSFADICFVRQDDESGARELAELALRRSIKRAVMIVPELKWAAIEKRQKGFSSVLRRNGIVLTVVQCDETQIDSIAMAVECVLGEFVPELLIGANDQIALIALKVLRQRGLRVPTDVMVTGYNGFPFTSISEPSLTTVRSPAYAMGNLGADLVFERLEKGEFPNRDYVLPVEVVIGGTV